jgi:hypothetical protein
MQFSSDTLTFMLERDSAACLICLNFAETNSHSLEASNKHGNDATHLQAPGLFTSSDGRDGGTAMFERDGPEKCLI